MDFDSRLIRGEPLPWNDVDFWLEHEGEVGEACRDATSGYGQLALKHPRYKKRDLAAFELAELGLTLSPTDESAAALAAVVDAFPESDARTAVLVRLGDFYFDRGNLEAAKTTYEAVISAADSESIDATTATYKLAWVHLNNAAQEPALELFEQVAKSDTTLAEEARIDLIYLFVRHRDLSTAPAYFRSMASNDEELFKLLRKVSRDAVIMGNLTKLLPVHEALLALDVPDRCDVLFEVATVRWRVRDKAGALSILGELETCADEGLIQDDYVVSQVRLLRSAWEQNQSP